MRGHRLYEPTGKAAWSQKPINIEQRVDMGISSLRADSDASLCRVRTQSMEGTARVHISHSS